MLSLDATGSLSNNGDVLLESGTKLSITGDEEVGSIEGGGDIELGTSRLTAGGLNTDKTFSGVIADLEHSRRAAAERRGGANTYTGQTAVSGGVLSLDATGSLSNSSDVLLESGTKLSITGGRGSGIDRGRRRY